MTLGVRESFSVFQSHRVSSGKEVPLPSSESGSPVSEFLNLSHSAQQSE